MKSTREIKVAVVAIICGCLLFFGFNFLKGVNIFSPIKTYVGLFSQMDGLTEQAPVYIKGYKVGQVDKIVCDFSREDAFSVLISVDKSIALPKGTHMLLKDDGLLGGKAIELLLPEGESVSYIHHGDTLPTSIELGLMATLQEGLLRRIDEAVADVDSLIASVNAQLSDDHLRSTLANADKITTDLSVCSDDLRQLTHRQLPGILAKADGALSNIEAVSADLRETDIQGAVAQVKGTVDTLQSVLTSKEGTLGLLLNDKDLYEHIDSTVVSVDNLVNDLKAHPKRYVHFSVFGGKKEK